MNRLPGSDGFHESNTSLLLTTTAALPTRLHTTSATDRYQQKRAESDHVRESRCVAILERRPRLFGSFVNYSSDVTTD